MDLGISFLPGFSQLSHLALYFINVSLTYIYNAIALQRVYTIKKNRDRSPYYYFLLLGIDAPVSLN